MTEPMTPERLAAVRQRVEIITGSSYMPQDEWEELVLRTISEMSALLDEIGRAREIIRSLVVHMDQVDVAPCCYTADCPLRPAHGYLESPDD